MERSSRRRPAAATAVVPRRKRRHRHVSPRAPTFRLEVPLGANNGPGDQVRFGNVVCAQRQRRPLPDPPCSPIRSTRRTPTSRCGRRPTVAVQINAATGQVISVRQGGAQCGCGVSASGNVIVGGESDLPGARRRRFFRSREVRSRPTAPLRGRSTSDARIKEDVRDLELGLSELRQVRPVRFRYNGRAGTPAGQAGVGVLGQEIETIFPETIQRVSVAGRSGARRHARLRPLGADVRVDQRGERAGRQGRAPGAGARRGDGRNRVPGQWSREARPSTMSEPVTISSAPPARISMDYSALRESGMELIRRWASESWTDHNVHDPGITILEACSYAMTELGLRLQLDVADLLRSGESTWRCRPRARASRAARGPGDSSGSAQRAARPSARQRRADPSACGQ